MKKIILLAALPLLVSAKTFNIGDVMDVIDATSKVANSYLSSTNGKKQEHTETGSFKHTNFPSNFSKSKKYLKQTTKLHGKSFYLDCDIKFTGRKGTKLQTDFSSCGYKSRGNKKRALRQEAEHIVPISWIGKNLQCWQNGGRKNCNKVSPEFNRAEADLVNLQYAVGEVNGDRSYYRYDDLTSGFDYGSNGRILIDIKKKRFMPPEDKKGWIGRVHLYMADTYGLQLSKSQLNKMKAWANKPATQWECQYNSKLQDDFGSSNPYTTKICISQN